MRRKHPFLSGLALALHWPCIAVALHIHSPAGYGGCSPTFVIFWVFARLSPTCEEPHPGDVVRVLRPFSAFFKFPDRVSVSIAEGLLKALTVQLERV